MLLALDLSTKNSGYAVFDNTILIASGCISASSADVIKRIFKMVTEIDKILQKYDIKKVVMEEVLPSFGHNSNTNVWKALTWLQAAMAFLLHEKYPTIEKKFVMPNSWRSKIGIHTGAGVKRAELKKKSIEFVQNKFNTITKEEDECEAIALGYSEVQKQKKEK